MLEALELTGFEATKNWTWNKDEYTKWLGHYWKWDSHAGEYKQPKSASVEAFPLVRLSVAFDNILKDLVQG
jgi:hypothetical protein